MTTQIRWIHERGSTARTPCSRVCLFIWFSTELIVRYAYYSDVNASCDVRRPLFVHDYDLGLGRPGVWLTSSVYHRVHNGFARSCV